MRSPGARIRKIAEVLLIALFVAALWLPLAIRLAHMDPKIVVNENRVLASLPSLEPRRSVLLPFPEKFEKFYGDRFGLRRALIQGLSVVRLHCFGVSSSSSVVVGKEGWLYYTVLPVGADYQTMAPFTPRELADWQKHLEMRRDWLGQRGIRYLFVVAPDKQSIYPEYLPDNLQKRGAAPSRLDQLVAHLREHSSLEIVDLREPLKQARATGRVYHITDTHWNYRGSYFAAQAIKSRLAASFPAIVPLSEADASPTEDDRPGGDLASMLGLSDSMPEHCLYLTPNLHRARRTGETVPATPGLALAHLEPVVAEVSDDSLPRAVVFHDSFGGSLVPYLIDDFRRIVFAPADVVDPLVVERERPDVVIQEMVERKLGLPPPPDAVILNGSK